MIHLAIIGAGDRTRKYLDYIKNQKQRIQVIAVAEPNPERRAQLAAEFALPDQTLFEDWEELLASSVDADAAIIATPDHLHEGPAFGALQKGWHLLLEKPIAQHLEACMRLDELARKQQCVVGICHVMRYFPAYVEIKKRITQGDLGTLISINHREPIGIDRMTHAFVRGIWNREADSNPLILSKTCHDLDLIVWLTEDSCESLASLGSLRWFRQENAPRGSAPRCLDCEIEESCRFSAIDLYIRRKQWLRHFDKTDEVYLRNYLRTSDYGRCVYHCNNDVVDNQNLIMKMRKGTLVTFAIDPFTNDKERTTHIMGTAGEIKGTESEFVHVDFKTGREERMSFAHLGGPDSYHYGSDHFLVEDFITAIEEGRKMEADLSSCLESHRIAFMAEHSRKTKKE